MAMTVACAHCGQMHGCGPEHCGRTFPCANCKQPLTVPLQSKVAVPRPVSVKKVGLLDLIRKSVKSVLDPECEARIASQAVSVFNDLARSGREFNLAESLAKFQVRTAESDDVIERVYGTALERAWQDRQVSDKERQSLQFIAQMLLLTGQQVSRLNGKKAKAAFEELFIKAIADGHVDDEEFTRLANIANSINSTVPGLCRMLFREEAEGLLRGVFAGVIENQRVVGEEWNRFLQTSERLGLSPSEVLQLVQPQAMTFVEHVLADAKADETLSEEEEQTLSWMLNVFSLPYDFATYVESQLRELRVLTQIAEGKLPSLTAAVGIETRAGEIVHFVDDAQYEVTKFLKGGPKVSRLEGRAVVTDSRLVFSSPTKSFTFNLRSVVECNLGTGCVDLRTTTKGTGVYYFRSNPQLAHAVIRAAVGRANQTIVAVSSGPSRHIPRDVRQRVWQRFGGRCVECQATQYLEFDHIIPVAKGGNNSDNNVQLLCRGCNLKKSDHI